MDEQMAYCQETDEMFDPDEWFNGPGYVPTTEMFHCTSPEAALAIGRDGFDLARMGEHTGNQGWYGRGIYFSWRPNRMYGPAVVRAVVSGKIAGSDVYWDVRHAVGPDPGKIAAAVLGRGFVGVLVDFEYAIFDLASIEVIGR